MRNIWKPWYWRIAPALLYGITMSLVAVLAAILIVPAAIFCVLVDLSEWSIRKMKLVPHCKRNGKCDDCDLMHNAKYNQYDEEQCDDYILESDKEFADLWR